MIRTSYKMISGDRSTASATKNNPIDDDDDKHNDYGQLRLETDNERLGAFRFYWNVI